MSKYTTEVRFICESVTGHTESEGFSSIENILTEAAPLIFDFEWPIYDENYRLPLERKILRHFYTREISEETLGLWKLRLDDRLNTIMPYYNQLYESALLEFNPLYDVDLKKSHTSEDTGNRVSEFNENDSNRYNDNSENHEVNSFNENQDVTHASERHTDGTESGANTTNTFSSDTSDGTSTKNQWDKYSDTPQGGVTGLDNFSGATVANMAYLTNARNISESDTSHKTGENSIVGSANSDISRKQDDSDSGNENTSRDGSNNTTSDYNSSGERSGNKNSTGTQLITNLNQYAETVVGKNGTHTYSSMLKEFRETFLNIDAMILEELKDLFFLLW